MTYQAHALADVQSADIGENTQIWQYVVILPRARVGSDCNICSHCFIENDVVVGNGTTLKNGVQLWDGIRIGDNVFVGPNVTFTNDEFPRSRIHPATYAVTTVANGASIGANATILPGVVIGENAMIGAGALVNRSVPPNAIVVGNPAAIIGYVGATQERRLQAFGAKGKKSELSVQSTAVEGVQVFDLPVFSDMRGSLLVGEFERHIPFVPKRYFMVFDVPSRETRGEHAHRVCQQFLVCVRGSCAAVVDDGRSRMELSLDTPQRGLYLPPMVWGVQYKYSEDAVLLVFASEHYDPDDYIRKYSDFLAEAAKR
jgi:acetyltransferase-like isoleucine patch superfamily enzyme/dTDP-4-dehydrorhamnose 3,5-epimerase-like enzyme